MKVFGVFMPYHKNEILDSCYEGYDELPSYPREYRRISLFSEQIYTNGSICKYNVSCITNI